MTQQNNWTVTLEEDPETKDLVMPIPTELLAQMGWDDGDILLWEEMPDGDSYRLTKKETDATG